MDAVNLTKVIAAFITIITSLIISIRVFTLNRTSWLNRWFALFFGSGSLGFLFYTIYHLITNNASVIIPLMITAQLFFNLLSISLLMTVIVLEKYEKVAMSMKYIIGVILLFAVMSVGYLIWPPELDTDSYALGIVNTDTDTGLLIFVNSFRIAICTIVVFRYVKMSKKLEGEHKKRIQWFYIGIIVVVIGLFINLLGSAIGSIPVEIIALFAIDIGSIITFKGFLI
ncbi:MAG: hypothetical protein EU533_08055 [Promethearchaeota archaeon]|nr:MAG: hypothetical protein EU533_08055 [Candidatus Lokiarchaeota archaeon]